MGTSKSVSNAVFVEYPQQVKALFSSVVLLRSATTLITAGRGDYYEHSHSYYELHLYYKGNAKYLVNKTQLLTITGAGYCFFPKKSTHQLTEFETGGVRLILAFDIVDEKIIPPNANVHSKNIPPQLFPLINHISRLSTSKSVEFFYEEYALLQALLVQLLIDYTDDKLILETEKKNIYLEKLDRFIAENNNRYIKTEEVLNYCGCTHHHLNRILKKYRGTQIGALLRNQRLQLISDLLQNTDLSLLEISHRSGFHSPQNMSVFFTREMATTPKQFRDRIIGPRKNSPSQK